MAFGEHGGLRHDALPIAVDEPDWNRERHQAPNVAIGEITPSLDPVRRPAHLDPIEALRYE